MPERAFETHEEAAEAFLALSLIVLGVAGVGLLRCELVYEFGAASAYTSPASSVGDNSSVEGAERGGADHDDDR